MANYLTNTEELTAIADAIREKTGESESLTFPSGFTNAIGDISGGPNIIHIYTGLMGIETIYAIDVNGNTKGVEIDYDVGLVYFEGDFYVNSLIFLKSEPDSSTLNHANLSLIYSYTASNGPVTIYTKLYKVTE